MNSNNLFARTKRLGASPFLELLLRWCLGLTFIYASYHKFLSPEQFAKIIYGYKLFPAVSINLIAIVLPAIELTCGLALLLGIFPRSAALLINIMLLGFILAISFNLIRGHEFSCGCFSFAGTSSVASTIELLIRDIFYFFNGVYVILFDLDRKWCLYSTLYPMPTKEPNV